MEPTPQRITLVYVPHTHSCGHKPRSCEEIAAEQTRLNQQLNEYLQAKKKAEAESPNKLWNNGDP